MKASSANSSSERDDTELKRNLSNRHIQLISLGGAIGTGLFMGSGKSISLAGPSLIFVYMIIGFMLFFVMRAMGELLLSDPDYKSFIDFAGRLLGPWAGYFTGWTYWLCWIVTGIADVIAVSAYAQFWFPDLPQWAPALSCIALLLSLNLITVKLFGEIEFWFAMIKLVAISVLVIIGVYLLVNPSAASGGHTPSLAHLWDDGGLFPHGWMGFFAGFQISIFAFVGIELVGTTAAETANPSKTLPRAINSIPVRIIIFYVLALITIMVVTPWREVVADKSPFVELFMIAGFPAAAACINFVVLSSAASSANSGIFSTSRMLFGLAQERNAPRSFARLSKRSVPSNGLLFSCLCLLLGAMLIYLIPDLMQAFTLITTLSALLFMFVWSVILLSYLAYRKSQPALHAASNYPVPGGKVMCWVVLAFFAFILILLTLKDDTRQALYLAPLWFLILGIAYPVVRRSGKDRTECITQSSVLRTPS